MNWMPEQRLELDPAIEEFIRRKQAAQDIQGGLAAMPSPSALPPAPVVVPPVAKVPGPFDIPPEVEQELKSYDAEQQRAATKREFQNGMDRAQAYFTGRPLPARETPQVDDSIRKFILTRKLGAGAKQGEAPVTDAEVAALVKAGIDPQSAQALRADPGTARKVLADHLGYRKPGEEKTPLVQHEAYVKRGAALKSPVLPTMGEKPADFAKRVEEQERLEGKGAKELTETQSKHAMELRKEFNGLPEVEKFTAASTLKKKVDEASPTGVGDIGLVYAYMTILDPGSSVKEGEVKMAQEASPKARQVGNVLQKLLNGDALDQTTRDQFKAEAVKLYEAQREEYQNAVDHYTEIAHSLGIKPELVIRKRGLPKQTAPVAPAAPAPGDKYLPPPKE